MLHGSNSVFYLFRIKNRCQDWSNYNIVYNCILFRIHLITYKFKNKISVILFIFEIVVVEVFLCVVSHLIRLPIQIEMPFQSSILKTFEGKSEYVRRIIFLIHMHIETRKAYLQQYVLDYSSYNFNL